MSEKVEQLERNFYDQQKLLWQIEWTLKNIERDIMNAISIKDVVITQQEKHKVSEARFIKIENKQDKFQDSINWINLKIAMVSWGWTVIMLMISKL